MGKKSKNKTQLSEQNPSVNGRGGKKSDLPPTPPPDVESEKSLRATEELPDKPKAVTDGRSATERGKKKNTKSKKPKKSKGIVSKLLGQITLKRFFFAYVFYVVLVCSDITPSELESSPTNQFICTNGISRYILKNDLFKKYIEPSITVAKVSIEEQVQPMYETHGKPLYAAVEPHLQTAYSYYVEYVKIPTTLLWRDVKKLYNDNAKEHVDKYYGQLSHAIGPYAAQGKEQVTIAYNAGVSKYKTVILPWYKKEVSPVLAKGWDKSTDIYYTTVKPTATDGWEKTKQFYNEVTIPAYYEHVHPLIIAAIDFIKEKYEVLFEDPAERKAKEEEERRAKEEAERKIREEAERKAKAKKEAERKAAERKAKEEAERKAKEEAERKARKEAERKAKQEANAALDNAAKSELTRYEDTVSESIFEFKVGIDDIAKARADEIATEISNLQSFADSQISSIKTRADELLADSTKNVTDKTYALGAAIKEIIDSLKTKSKEIKRKSKEAIENARSEISIKRDTAELNLENQLSEANFNLDTIVKKHPKADSNRLSQARVQISADVVQGKKSIGIFTDEVLSSIVDTKTQEITTIATDALERIKIARALSDQAFQQQHEELVRLQFEAELAKQVEATVKDKQDVVDESVDATTKKADGAGKIAKSTKPASDTGNVKIVDEADDDEAVFEKLMAGYREYKANIEEEEDDEDEEESCDVEGTC